MINLIIRGCNGRLGQVISEIVENDEEIRVVAGIDLMPLTNGTNAYPVFEHLAECTVLADVVVDCSSPKGLTELLTVSRERKLPIVLCTTGFSEEQLLEVEQASKEIAILRSANMSLGINTLAKLAEAAAKIFAEAGFDMEIVERHHNKKVDAPSGTALLLADRMNAALDGKYHYTFDRSGRRQARDPKEIGISAVRGGTIVGEHEIIFAGRDEVIELKHTAYSREVFGTGAVQAAKFLAGKKAGMYDMQSVVGA
ncbi:MAG: 4-hydroxy-tetrahydrodipicolinate reductase [Lachnospiraceae bacterium]|nr:4-hydroxy-tetrahydrodipicolinate reductase [Lachnospiraceae bacterium]